MLVTSADAKAALEVCENLLSSLKVGGPTGRAQFEANLHADGCMAHARYSRAQGVFFHDFQGQLQDYVHAAWEVDQDGKKIRDMEEAIDGDPTVLVDHDIATVWTPYWFRTDGKLSHVGTNSFGLLKVYYDQNGEEENKEGKGEWKWKIVVIHDTARLPTEHEAKRLDDEYADRMNA